MSMRYSSSPVKALLPAGMAVMQAEWENEGPPQLSGIDVVRISGLLHRNCYCSSMYSFGEDLKKLLSTF
jgi:hypothetical protein